METSVLFLESGYDICHGGLLPQHPTLTPLDLKVCRSAVSSKSFRLCILAQFTKIWWQDSWVKGISTIRLWALHRYMSHCTIPSASWLHHHIVITHQCILILCKGVDNQYDLDRILDNSIAITHLCWSFRNGYILEVMLNFPCVIL
jgi:hypothetical protein